jgi:hypothetical protein
MEKKKNGSEDSDLLWCYATSTGKQLSTFHAFEMPVTIYQSIRRNIQEYLNLQQFRRENLTSPFL